MVRRVKKRGGMQFEANIFECPTTKTGKKMAESSCAKEFAKENKFIIVATADDGNCFYDSLSKFGQRTGFPALNKSHIELRNNVVDNMLTNIEDLQPYFVNAKGNPLTKEGVRKEIEILRTPGIWDTNGGDIVIQYAANVFNVNITIYDIHVQDPNNIINRLILSSTEHSDTNVNILRIHDSHYQLLWHSDSPTLPRGKRTLTAKKKQPLSNTKNKPKNQTNKINNPKNKNKLNGYNSNNSLTKALQQIAMMESSNSR